MIKFDFNEETLDFFDEHKVPLALAALVGISALANSDSIRQSYESFAQYRDANMALSSSTRMLEVSQRATKKSAEIARQRFENGCVPVASPDNRTVPIAPTEGQTVIDPTTGASLPVGTVVCYISGHTGVLESSEGEVPIVSEIAFTGEIEPVRKAFPDELIDKYRLGIGASPKPQASGGEGK
jgi:hypothetical protein